MDNQIIEKEVNFSQLFVRMPKPGTKCSISGLSRSYLYKVTSGTNPSVAWVSLATEPENKRGSRMMIAQSLIENILRTGSDVAASLARAGYEVDPELIAAKQTIQRAESEALDSTKGYPAFVLTSMREAWLIGKWLRSCESEDGEIPPDVYEVIQIAAQYSDAA